MDTINHLKEYILTVHPVRKSRWEKEEFRKWAASELKKAGWRVQEETYGRTNGSVNLLAGDPERAEVFLCAHYDTATRMLLPNFVSPTNVLVHVGYHIAMAVLLLAAVFLLSLAVAFPLGQPGLMLPLFLVLAVAALWVSARGPANKNNANGNSSGVVALLRLARSVKDHKRVCLVLFDNNGKNMLGASGFKKKHPQQATTRLFINLDCVGDGEHLLLIPSKYSRWDGDLLDDLGEAFPGEGGMQSHVLSHGLQYYPSDHKKFKFNVAVCACHRLAGIGYYIPHLRTRRDTALRQENIQFLTEGMERFLELYLDEKSAKKDS